MCTKSYSSREGQHQTFTANFLSSALFTATFQRGGYTDRDGSVTDQPPP